jgi:hypothetical protein
MMKVQSVLVPVPIHPRQDPPTLRNGLRTEGNHRRTTQLDEMFPSSRKWKCYLQLEKLFIRISFWY